MDSNKNGKIEFQEFLEKMAERNERHDMSEDLRNVRYHCFYKYKPIKKVHNKKVFFKFNILDWAKSFIIKKKTKAS